MTRSLKKGLYTQRTLKLLEKIEKNKQKQSGASKPIKTWFRSSIITPEMVGFTFSIHNGRSFIKREIIEEMVGKKLGEFSPTRHQQPKHGKAGKH